MNEEEGNKINNKHKHTIATCLNVFLAGEGWRQQCKKSWSRRVSIVAVASFITVTAGLV
jgi:hypothetical protein